MRATFCIAVNPQPEIAPRIAILIIVVIMVFAAVAAGLGVPVAITIVTAAGLVTCPVAQAVFPGQDVRTIR